MNAARNPAQLLVPGRPLTLAGVADGAEALIVADLARAVAGRGDGSATSLAVVCRDGPGMAALARALHFFAPDLTVQEFPAWDCLPYDRVSPHAGFVAQRMTTLSRLVRAQGHDHPSVVLTTVNAGAGAGLRCAAVAVGCARSCARDGRHHPMARTQWVRTRIDGT